MSTKAQTKTKQMIDGGEGWVSVEDRLPCVGMSKDAGLQWIVYHRFRTALGYSSWTVGTSSLHPGNWGMLFGDEREEVSHWMPMPNPPEVQDGEDPNR